MTKCHELLIQQNHLLGANRSGEADAKIAIRVPWVIPVHIRTIVIEVADVHEVAVRSAPAA